MASIRCAAERDAPALARVRPGYDDDNVAQRFRTLSGEVDGEWLLLVEGNEILGWGVLKWSGKKSHPEYPDVEDLYLRKEHRDRGLGTRLLTHMEDLARERGFGRLGLAVNPDLNPDAHRLYERLGYRHDGGPSYVDGIYNGVEDRVIDMEKDLA